MNHQKDQLRRDMLNNPRIYQSVLETVETGMAPSIRVSDRHNAVYGAGDFIEGMVRASLRDGKVAGCSQSARLIAAAYGARRRPSDEWMRQVALRSDAAGIQENFEATVAAQLDSLYRTRALGRGQKIDVAIDMHLIPRYDRRHGEELVRSKARGKTGLFERYIPMQCIVCGGRLVLGVFSMSALKDTADFVRKTIDSARRAGARLGTVLLDREFFSTKVISALKGARVKYLMPCRNTGGVVGAIGEFAAGSRGPSCRGRTGTCSTPWS